MIKLSKDEAFSKLDDASKNVIDYELDSLHSQAANAGKEMTYEFFQEDDATIALVVSWNDEKVEVYRFMNASSDFEYESEVKFELHDSEGFLEKVMDTNLKDAIGYFRDNYGGEGKFFIEWFDEEPHRIEIVL